LATVTAAVSAANTGNNAALTTTSFTPTAGDLLVAFAVVSGQASGGTFTDSQSLGWDTLTTALKSSSGDSLVFAVARNLAAASGTTVTFTPAGSPTSSGVAIAVLRVAGMTRTGSSAVRVVGATRNIGSESNVASGTPAPALPAAALTGNATVGAVANGANPATLDAPVGWTERFDTGYNTPATGLEAASRNSGFTGTTVTWGSSSATPFASVIAELDASVPVDPLDVPVTGKWPDASVATVYLGG
jgi:hypothetical protein